MNSGVKVSHACGQVVCEEILLWCFVSPVPFFCDQKLYFVKKFLGVGSIFFIDRFFNTGSGLFLEKGT